MTTTLLILRGLPASGKSTFSHEWVAEDPDWRARVNRDDLRWQSYGKYWGLSRLQEENITRIEHSLTRANLEAGISVVVDATNLRAKTVREWYRLALKVGGVSVVVKDIELPLEECIARDAKRERTVGEKVLRDFYARYFPKGKMVPPPSWDEEVSAMAVEDGSIGVAYVGNPDLPKAVWLDVDGTAAERVWDGAVQPVRGPYDETRVLEDMAHEHIKDLVWALKRDGYAIVVMSGRTEACLDDTLEWFDRTGYPPIDDIFMRPVGDKRKDCIVKEDLFWNKVAPKYDIRFALDDRQQVVDHTRNVLKIPVLQVAPGNF